MSGSASMMARRPTRTTRWSSTIRTRIFVFSDMALPVLAGALRRDRDRDLRPLSGAALHRQLAQAGGPLADAQQTEVSGPGPGGLVGVEAPPVVGDRQLHAAPFVA